MILLHYFLQRSFILRHLEHCNSHLYVYFNAEHNFWHWASALWKHSRITQRIIEVERWVEKAFRTNILHLTYLRDLTLQRAVAVICCDLVSGAYSLHHVPHPPAWNQDRDVTTVPHRSPLLFSSSLRVSAAAPWTFWPPISQAYDIYWHPPENGEAEVRCFHTKCSIAAITSAYWQPPYGVS